MKKISTFTGPAAERAKQALETLDLACPETWVRLSACAGHIMNVASTLFSKMWVQDRIDAALFAQPHLIGSVLTASASWVEKVDSQDRHFIGRLRQYRSVPAWLPLGRMVETIRQEWPKTEPAQSHFADTDSLELLASQFLLASTLAGPE